MAHYHKLDIYTHCKYNASIMFEQVSETGRSFDTSDDAAQLLQEASSPDTPGLFKTQFPDRDTTGYDLVFSDPRTLEDYLNTPLEQRASGVRVLVNFSDEHREAIRGRTEATVAALIKHHGLPEGSTSEDLGKYLSDMWAKEDAKLFHRSRSARIGRIIAHLVDRGRAFLRP